MRIGFDGTCLANRRGFGRFTRELLTALAASPMRHELLVLIDDHSMAQGSVAIPARFESIIVPVRRSPSQAASADGRRDLRDLLAMGHAAAAAQLDALYLPSTYSAFPVWNVPRLIATVHDTMPLSHPDLIFRDGRGRLAWTLKERYAVTLATRIVTLSHSSKHDIIHYYGVREDRIRLLPEAASAVFRPLEAHEQAAATKTLLSRFRLDPRRPYLLYVGGFSPHKNLPSLIQAFARASDPSTLLVLAGDLNDVFNTHVPELRALITQLNLDSRVVWTGYVADPDLRILYARARALALPSLIEGFGLTAIEAMACGTPVTCSRAASMPEVVGPAGLYFDPNDIDTIVTALRQILNDDATRADLAAQALQRSRLFTWNAAAHALCDVFDELAPQADPQCTRGPASRIAGSALLNRSKFAWNNRAKWRARSS